MGLRPTNSEEKHAGGECRANMTALRACFPTERAYARTTAAAALLWLDL